MESLLLDRLSALSHAQRMAVFRLLMRRYPDALPAGEISAALALKASTTSVYLSALTRVGLIRQRRRGTSLLYALDMHAARAVVNGIFFDCCFGRPDLCPPDLLDPLGIMEAHPMKRYNVLFICTGNSARSIFAEAILHHLAGDRFNAYSAGTKPYSELNAFAVEMLENKGMDVARLRSKNVAEFQTDGSPEMDFVFTVCDHAANEDCPAWPGQPISAHWGLPDPVKADGTEAQRRLAFQETYGAMRNRIEAFSALSLDKLDRITLQRHVDDIGRAAETA